MVRKFYLGEVPATKTEYRLWWGLPVSFVDATLGIPIARVSDTKVGDGLTRRPEV